MKKYFLAILLTVLTTFAFSSRAGALSDIVYNVDTSSTFPFYFCDNSLTNSQVKCSDYGSIVFSPYHVADSYFTIAVNNTTVRIPNYTDTIFDLSSIDAVFIATANNNSFTTVRVTLTESIDCPDCPDPLPPDRSAIMDDFHNVFLNTFVGVIPISAIIFVVWFMIDMLSSLIFGRGK